MLGLNFSPTKVVAVQSLIYILKVVKLVSCKDVHCMYEYFLRCVIIDITSVWHALLYHLFVTSLCCIRLCECTVYTERSLKRQGKASGSNGWFSSFKISIIVCIYRLPTVEGSYSYNPDIIQGFQTQVHLQEKEEGSHFDTGTFSCCGSRWSDCV